VEALWRTLLADCYEEQCPAPLECGFGFADWVCTKIALDHHVLSYKRNDSNDDQANYEMARKRMDAKPEAWSSLDEREDGGFAYLPELQRLAELASPECEDGYEMDLKNAGIRFLPDRHRINHWPGEVEGVPARETGETGWDRDHLAGFKARIAEVRAGTRMFRTQKGYLSMGPRSATEHDQVWILPGANVPFVLRPLENGNYRVIGEAFVYLLNGWRGYQSGEEEFRQIVLG
jgi:hypothetical protein